MAIAIELNESGQTLTEVNTQIINLFELKLMSVDVFQEIRLILNMLKNCFLFGFDHVWRFFFSSHFVLR